MPTATEVAAPEEEATNKQGPEELVPVKEEDDDFEAMDDAPADSLPHPAPVQQEPPRDMPSARLPVLQAHPHYPQHSHQHQHAPYQQPAAIGAKPPKRQYNLKNPHRPKRPLSAYNVFFKYERERLVREEMMKEGNADEKKVEEIIAIKEKTKTGKRVHRKTHGAIAFADLGKLIAKNWKALPDSERAKYNAEANVDKERYQRELEECNANMPVEQKEPAVPGPKIRNKRLGDGVSGGFEKRAKSSNGWPGYQDEGQSAVEQPFGPSSRGPPPYYDPYFGYGRAGAEGYGPPPPGYGGPPPPIPGPYGYYPPPPPDYYYGRPPPMPPGESKEAAQQHQAFAPQYPYPYPGYPPRPPVPMQAPNQQMPPSPQRWMPPDGPENQHVAECAYQCEVCNNAVFSSYKECADHEEECAKKHGNASQDQEEKPPPQPSPNTQKKEEREQRDAVEAVMRLKTA